MKKQTLNLRRGFLTVLSIGFVLAMVFSSLAPVGAGSLNAPSGQVSQSSTGSDAPTTKETSAFMMGKVAVGVVALESTGAPINQEDWSDTELQNVNREVRAGLKRWADWGGAAANLQFYVDVNGDGAVDDDPVTYTSAVTEPTVAISKAPVNIEPIAQSSGTYDVWTGTALGNIGYSGTTTEERWYAYTSALRQQGDSDPANNTNWAFIIFVVDSSTDFANDTQSPGRFVGGAYMVTRTFGPAGVMTYNNGSLGINNMDLVTAQLTARMFGAAFQDEPSCNSNTTQKFGYLAIPNTYCAAGSPVGEPNPRLMYHLTNPAGTPDSITRQQVGWKDSDGDGKYDPVDTRPVVIFSPYAPDPTTDTVLEYIEAPGQQYRTYEPPLAATACSTSTDECYYKYYFSALDTEPAVTINTIQSVQYRVDGAATWTSISGSFDTDYEIYTFSAPTSGGGKHKIEVRSTNSQGISSYVVADEVTVLVAPDNDPFANRIEISALPYNHGVDTSVILDANSLDTTDPIPPAASCDQASALQGKRSVWYWYRPQLGDEIFLNTNGSTYDTVLSVWQDVNGDGDFTNPEHTEEETEMVACDDDGGGTYSKLSFMPDGDETYYIMISEFNNTGASAASAKPELGGQVGGALIFNALTTGDVSVYIGSGLTPTGSYKLKPSESKRVNYVGVDSGPVRITIANNQKLIAALRDAYFVDGKVESFAQLMGLPKEQLSDTYYFPAYNNVTLDGQLRFANVGNEPTTVTVTIGGIERGSYLLQANESKRVNYALDTGPVVIKSSSGVPIIAALRDAYFVNGKLESFVQLMGLPKEKLSTTYYFPAYNNVTLDGQLRFGNVGSSTTTVTVTIGGVVRGTYTLAPSESQRVTYPLDTGPVVIKSSGGVPIIAALRDAYFVDGKLESFAQLMGMPAESLSTTYYFPAYNNVTLDGQLRFGNIGTSSTIVTVTIGGIERGSYTLAPSESKRVTYPLDTGPVVINSSGNVPIIAALRDAYFVSGKLVSFVQLMGLPAAALSDTYYFPAYNNVTLDGQLRFGIP